MSDFHHVRLLAPAASEGGNPENQTHSIMTKHIFLIQGAGASAYEVDKRLATSLSYSLGPQYGVHYPALPHEGDASYEEWKHHLEKELAPMQGPIVLVGHSERQRCDKMKDDYPIGSFVLADEQGRRCRILFPIDFSNLTNRLFVIKHGYTF